MSGRKVWVRCGMMLLIALMLLCSSALAALKYPFYTVTTDSVRLRKTASLKAIVVEDVAAGTKIEVTGKSGKFYKVDVNGTKGYIHQDYVSLAESDMSTPTPLPDKSGETVEGYPYETVTTAGVNLRESKSTSSTQITKIPSGASVVVRALSGSWAEIEYGPYVGYVKQSYVALKKVAKATPTPTPEVTLSPEENESSYQVLTKGSQGDDVKALQQALIELGFLNGEADGKFGPATENALILFEQANDYPISAEADANLQAFLYNGKPKNSKGVATKVTVVSAVSGASMQQGNTGVAVVKLQERLTSLGYYSGSATGTYDSATKKAVTAFQKKNGLTADGVAGKSTQDVLYSNSALSANETPTPSPSPTPTAVPVFTIPSGKVKLNTEGEDAKLVQQRLKDLKYYTGRVDGKFGSASVKALKAFQEHNGLEADGVAGETTYQILFSWGALAKGETATATPVPETTVVPGTATTVTLKLETLRKGDSGDAVKLMQEALINLGYLSGTADGIYGATTVSAVKSFQKVNGLTADGVAGNATLSMLYSTGAKANPATPTPKPTATPAPDSSTKTTTTTASTLLKKGSKGDAVKALQQRLIDLGYLTGKADGIFGTATYKALVAFQKANGLAADGKAGTLTQSALSGSSVKAASTTSTATTSAASSATVKVASSTTIPKASSVIYANWYTTVKAIAKKYPYATIYDYKTGISWQIHIFSLGAHADYEPLSANDTSKMLKVFGGNTWNPRAVWVIFADGSVYMASTHSNPHGTQHITSNNFDGHSCLHFPRTQAQVESIGTYATSHQETIDAGWAATQAMTK